MAKIVDALLTHVKKVGVAGHIYRWLQWPTDLLKRVYSDKEEQHYQNLEDEVLDIQARIRYLILTNQKDIPEYQFLFKLLISPLLNYG